MVGSDVLTRDVSPGAGRLKCFYCRLLVFLSCTTAATLVLRQQLLMSETLLTCSLFVRNTTGTTEHL